MKIIKRSGIEEDFDSRKIFHALKKANDSVMDLDSISDQQIKQIVSEVTKVCKNSTRSFNVEEIQDLVENQLMSIRAFNLARNYITYRYRRSVARKLTQTDQYILSLIESNNEEVKQENSNKNPRVNSVQRDYMAGEVSKDITKRFLLPSDIWEAHEQGIIHFHDSDYYAQHMDNCCLANLEDMLQNGTVISGTRIDKPHSFAVACNIATQAIAQIASSQYGGQTINLAHLIPFVDISRQRIRSNFENDLQSLGIECADINAVVERRVLDEINRGVQTIQYQLITLMTTNGQAPFVSIFLYRDDCKTDREKEDYDLVVREILLQRIQGVKNEQGAWVTPAFPKLLYVLTEENLRKGSKEYENTLLAAQCSAKRLVPDYLSEKKLKELKNGHVYGCMGCRSFPTVDRTIGNVAKALNYEEGKPKYWGRFNQGVVTLNLVDVALTAGKDEKVFWDLLDERLELCHRALRCRHERLKGTIADASPILWRYGANARLDAGETIDKLLVGGYSTISLGYVGLHEMCVAFLGKSLITPEGKSFAKRVMQRLNDKCAEWKAAEDIDYSVYGTPIESTTYRFAKCLQRRFGIIEGVTDHNYITNSYHVCVREKINAFEKLEFESELQELSPGGAISYVEVPDLKGNIEAVLSLMRFMYDHILYAEINTKSDYCMECGFDGEIKIIEDGGKLIWECPNCGNRDQTRMSVARRTCGYIGTQFWNQGRTQEIRDRVLHL